MLNKIDLKNADPDRVTKQLEMLFDMSPSEVLKVTVSLVNVFKSIILHKKDISKVGYWD